MSYRGLGAFGQAVRFTSHTKEGYPQGLPGGVNPCDITALTFCRERGGDLNACQLQGDVLNWTCAYDFAAPGSSGGDADLIVGGAQPAPAPAPSSGTAPTQKAQTKSTQTTAEIKSPAQQEQQRRYLMYGLGGVAFITLAYIIGTRE